MKSIDGLKRNLRVAMDVLAKDRFKATVDLIERVYLTSPATTTFQAPFGSRYCVARVLGAGGGAITDAATPVGGWYVGGGGGAFARSTFQLRAGQVLTVQVGKQSATASDRVSKVLLNAITLASADGGTPSNLNANGAGGTGGIGDEIVTGGNPSNGRDGNGFWYGGDGIGDTSDADSVLCAGNGVKVRDIGSGPLLSTPARFGGGSAIFYNGSASSSEFSGGGGLIVLEFYTGDPR